MSEPYPIHTPTPGSADATPVSTTLTPDTPEPITPEFTSEFTPDTTFVSATPEPTRGESAPEPTREPTQGSPKQKCLKSTLFVFLTVVTLCVIAGAVFFGIQYIDSLKEEEESAKSGGSSAEGSQWTSNLHTFANLRTPRGVIVFEMLPQAAPKTVAHFEELAKTGWYDGTTLHRYEKGICLDGGRRRSASSTPSPPLGTVPLEYNADYPTTRWFVVMSRERGSPDSATTEFSIMLEDNSNTLSPGGLDAYGHTVFAKVVGGKEVMQQFARMRTKSEGNVSLLDPPQPILSIDMEVEGYSAKMQTIELQDRMVYY